MNIEKIKNKGQAHIFKNSILEALSKTHPWVIYAIYIPAIFYLVNLSQVNMDISWIVIAGIFFSGILFWTLFEYLMHRYLFHFRTNSEFAERMVYIFHGNHHEFPKDPERLFMPPLPSLIMSVIVQSIFYSISLLVFGSGYYAFTFFAGFLLGYLFYVSLHFAIHRYKPPKYLKALWRNHTLHHYNNPERDFGVSSPFWDICFGTYISRKKGET